MQTEANATKRHEWVRPVVQRLEAGSAEANSTITGRGDGVGQQES